MFYGFGRDKFSLEILVMGKVENGHWSDHLGNKRERGGREEKGERGKEGKGRERGR